MEPLQIQLSLLHDLIDVFWKSIEAREFLIITAMGELQIKMCLAHDLIDVYWTSIDVRNGFINYKYYSESRFLPRLQKIVQAPPP
mgnify:FL=1